MAVDNTERGSRPNAPILSFCELLFQNFASIAAVLLLAGAANSAVAAASRDGLQVYFIDVEGGQATLFVTPAGESLLIEYQIAKSMGATQTAS